MTRETRVSLLIGLGLIIAFGVILSEMKGTSSQPAGPTAAEEFNSFSLDRLSYDLQPEERLTPPRRRAAAAAPPDQPTIASTKTHLTDSPAKAQQVDRQRIYVVEPNDSLIKIAMKEYGPDNAQHYKLIYQANRDTLENVAMVRVGQRLVIPPLGDRGSTLRALRARDRQLNNAYAARNGG